MPDYTTILDDFDVQIRLGIHPPEVEPHRVRLSVRMTVAYDRAPSADRIEEVLDYDFVREGVLAMAAGEGFAPETDVPPAGLSSRRSSRRGEGRSTGAPLEPFGAEFPVPPEPPEPADGPVALRTAVPLVGFAAPFTGAPLVPSGPPEAEPAAAPAAAPAVPAPIAARASSSFSREIGAVRSAGGTCSGWPPAACPRRR